jgi:hypothetical protein
LSSSSSSSSFLFLLRVWGAWTVTAGGWTASLTGSGSGRALTGARSGLGAGFGSPSDFGADVGGLAGGFVGCCFGADVGGAGALVGFLLLLLSSSFFLGALVAGALVAGLAGSDADFSGAGSALGAAFGAALGALAGAGPDLDDSEWCSSLSARPIAAAAGTISTLCRTSPPASRVAPSLRMPPGTPDIGNLRVGHPLVIVYQRNGLNESGVMHAPFRELG